MKYQPSGLQASRTHHLHLYAETEELRKRVELAVWEIYNVLDNALVASACGRFTDIQQ